MIQIDRFQTIDVGKVDEKHIGIIDKQTNKLIVTVNTYHDKKKNKLLAEEFIKIINELEDIDEVR